ncbi:AdoMet-dependent rRNA methyltransferase spb1 [Cyanidiococcus yangmingshanensis]|uniref:AdoMet-dependent rRNA methyltransferase spb1 n=1 Tax=Cyanidiococcus yangmingshanensis TaxID=2690220 RepID=A0A7J7INR7_9RHOD|nr:AdoMet-dependent rRNA methyltransferase spb1 [Cyanidiococcus yangmingshanensis]
MARKHKTGKQRLDRYYHLAKEHGYRSRAAFKLLQLNRRHGFLGQASRGVLDLCAAPGGWLQVCRQHMPVAAPCIGVDLVPIAPIRNCTSIVGDITSEKCIRMVQQALVAFGQVLDPHGGVSAGGTSVDVVLSDASPNMGAAWVQDAYNQAELTLHALRMASVFLHRGGWFVSKLFRSADSDAFLLVVRGLFQRVYVTKPPASRQQSAEIYVVCKGYLAPTRLDPALFDPRRVFSDPVAIGESVNVLTRPEDQRNWRQMQNKERVMRRQLLSGRPLRLSDDHEAQAGSLARRTCSLKAFLESPFPALILSKHQALEIEDEDALPEAAKSMLNAEIRDHCRDLGVCGPKDFRRLFKFHAAVHRSSASMDATKRPDATISAADDETAPVSVKSPSDSPLEHESIASRMERRLERKAERKRARMLARQQGRHTETADAAGGYDLGFTDLFSLRGASSPMRAVPLDDDATEAIECSSLEDEENRETERMADLSDAASESHENPIDDNNDSDSTGIEEDRSLSETSLNDDDDDDDDRNGALASMSETMKPLEAGARRWLARLGVTSLDQVGDLEFAANTHVEEDRMADTVDSDSSCSSSEPEKESIGTGVASSHDRHRSRAAPDVARGPLPPSDSTKTTDPVPEMDERTRAELLTVARQYMLRRSARQVLVDATYNRHAFDDPSDLPRWFVEDEKRARQPPPLVDEAAIKATEAQLRAPLEHLPKRVREARQRRQTRQQRLLDAARQEAQAIARTQETSAGNKIRQIARTVRRARMQRRQRPVPAVLRSGRAIPVAGRSRTSKPGQRVRYKLVDRRLKADLRARQRRRR